MPFGSIPLNDGQAIPGIAFGTGSVWKSQDVTKYVAQALESGFSHIDTAAFYANEDSVGRAIRESGLARHDFYLTTKFSLGEEPLEEIQKSLDKLGIKSVDLYLIHSPYNRDDRNLQYLWTEFEKVRDQGFATSIGVSNFLVNHLEAIAKVSSVVPAVNQINLHLYNYAEMKPVLDYCTKHNIVIEAYSSLTPVTKFPGGPVDAPLAAAAQRRGASTTQIAQLWVKSKGAVIVTTSSRKEHLEEYLAVADLPPLTDEEINALEEAAKQGPPSQLRLYMFRFFRTSGRIKLLVLLGVLLFASFHCFRCHI